MLTLSFLRDANARHGANSVFTFSQKINVPSFKFSNKGEKPSYFFHRSAICSVVEGH